MFEYRVPVAEHIALPQHPRLLFSLAIGMLGDAAAFTASGQASVELAEESVARDRYVPAEDLSFSATFFDAYIDTYLNEELTQEFSILCASAYYLSGGPGNSKVVASKTPPPAIDLGGGLLRAIHAILNDDYRALDGPHTYSDYTNGLMAAFRAYFAMGGDEGPIIEICDELRSIAYEDGASSHVIYADIIGAIARGKMSNAARSLLPPASDLPLNAWIPALLKEHFPKELWPAQKRICSSGLLVGRSAIIQMPTSAGKTRATELIIRSAFISGRASLAVIVAPYRSLCHDIRGDLTKAFAGEDIKLDEVSDSYRFDLSLEAILAQRSVLIVTPEKLLYMLRRAPELAQRIDLVIYDEGHQFDGMARGPTYELLLSSLKLALPATTQVVLISAVIGNAPDIAAWLINDANAIVAGDGLLPTKKSIAFASWQDARGRLEYVSPLDPDEREFWVPRVIEELPLPALPRERKQRVFPARKGTEIGLYLGLHLVANGSVAVFCGRRDSATGLCKKIVELVDRGAQIKNPREISNDGEIAKLNHLFALNLGAGAAAARAAHVGVLAHHSSIPHGVRLAVEHAMKSGLAKFVICTSTLAQGVNFPIKYLIVTSVQQGQDRILVRDFHNLIGRAGRAGMHTEGSVIFSTPELFDERATRRGRWKWEQTKLLLDASNSEPSASSILALFRSYEQTVPPIVLSTNVEILQSLAFASKESLDAVVSSTIASFPLVSEREFRAFLNGSARAVQSITSYLLAHMTFLEAALSETVQALASNTLAYHLADAATKPQVVALFQGIAGAIATNAGTEELRAVIRKSPLPPATVARIRSWLTEHSVQLTQLTQPEQLLSAIFPVISSELSATVLRSLSTQEVVPQILSMWIAGRAFHEIHTFLFDQDVRFSGDRITIDDVVAIRESAFGYDLAMIVATMADLTEESVAALSGVLGFLQRQIKSGLPSASAISIYESGFSDRPLAQAMALTMPAVTQRWEVRGALVGAAQPVRVLLATYPSYFGYVLDELLVN
jgi:superfamily II DNA/RNA helicase